MAQGIGQTNLKFDFCGYIWLTYLFLNRFRNNLGNSIFNVLYKITFSSLIGTSTTKNNICGYFIIILFKRLLQYKNCFTIQYAKDRYTNLVLYLLDVYYAL